MDNFELNFAKTQITFLGTNFTVDDFEKLKEYFDDPYTMIIAIHFKNIKSFEDIDPQCMGFCSWDRQFATKNRISESVLITFPEIKSISWHENVKKLCCSTGKIVLKNTKKLDLKTAKILEDAKGLVSLTNLDITSLPPEVVESLRNNKNIFLGE